jgi:membrane-associated protease RseP (regulator of RpoE activity)
MTEITERRPDAPPPYPHPPGEHGDDRGELATGAWRLGAVIAAVLGLGLWAGFSLVVVILALVVMIFFHELGHYVTAKWAGMKVTEFFIGFGPKIWSFRRGETEYGLKAIPAGAYVRIIGMSNLEEVPPEDEPRTYRQKSYGRRMSVAVAGSTMHFLMAAVCILILLAGTGIRGGTVLDIDKLDRTIEEADIVNGPWVVGDLVSDSAAERAGLESGDRVVSVAGDPVDDWESLGAAVRPRGGEEVDIVVERDGREQTLTTVLGEQDGRGFLGVGPDFTTSIHERVPFPEAVVQTGREFGLGMKMAAEALGTFFTGGIGDFASQVVAGGETRVPEPTTGGGPAPANGDGGSSDGENRLISIYGAVRIGDQLTGDGIAGLLFFLVSINIFVGVFNLVPLLPLDGGHVAIATYERVRSRKGRRYMADISRLMPLTYAVVLVLILLGLSSLYLDIVSPIDIG